VLVLVLELELALELVPVPVELPALSSYVSPHDLDLYLAFLFTYVRESSVKRKVLLLVSMVYILTTVTSRIDFILITTSVYRMHGSHSNRFKFQLHVYVLKQTTPAIRKNKVN